MDIKEQAIKELFLLLEDNKTNIEWIVSLAEKLKVTDTQEYLDYEDFLNRMSIKDHNDRFVDPNI